MSAASNPGSATPQSLHRLYKNQAAATANPYTLRQFSMPAAHVIDQKTPMSFHRLLDLRKSQSVGARALVSRKRSDSPPRASFKCITGGYTHSSVHW